MKEIKFKINGQDDRRDLMAILADYGYKVRINRKEVTDFDEDYYVIVELDSQTKQDEGDSK